MSEELQQRQDRAAYSYSYISKRLIAPDDYYPTYIPALTTQDPQDSEEHARNVGEFMQNVCIALTQGKVKGVTDCVGMATIDVVAECAVQFGRKSPYVGTKDADYESPMDRTKDRVTQIRTRAFGKANDKTSARSRMFQKIVMARGLEVSESSEGHM